MKAMILAAGLGTRLRPYTNHRPKALFTLGGKPVLGLAIERARDAGCTAVAVNTHHGHRQIESFLGSRDFGIPVHIMHEPEILGTGGALANVADYWRTDDLLVINADIVSDIDLRSVWRDHQAHGYPVTMVMHHHDDFNSVAVNDAGFITRFKYRDGDPGQEKSMAFTGIHVLAPRVLDFLPSRGPAHIIDAYTDMLAAGERIRAHIPGGHTWHDIGTPQRYHRAAVAHMAPMAFETAYGTTASGTVQQHRLHGDGSDRQWHRMEKNGRTMIMADHGLTTAPEQQEVDAYVAIGAHLEKCKVPVPHIYLHDRCSGLVFVEDLGDQLLQAELAQMQTHQIQRRYSGIIDAWITMAVTGAREFDPAWTFQSTHYDRSVFMEKECRYFMEAFIRDHLGWRQPFEAFEPEFERLADRIDAHAVNGFMHRDLQSRNIMVNQGRVYFIDFQGGRLGPLQYDLASLLIDPYAGLDRRLQQRLLTYASGELARRHGIDPDRFRHGYDVCALARNLQILGAFAFLNDTKGKTWFADYIPRAVASLHHNLSALQSPALPGLTSMVEKLLEVYPEKV